MLEPTTGIEPVNLILTKDALYLLSYVGIDMDVASHMHQTSSSLPPLGDQHSMRPLKNVPFRSLRLSAQSLCCIRILIPEIFKIFLWLKSSCALILTKIEHFSKVSLN